MTTRFDMTALQQVAAAQRELFQAFVGAGFSEFQACVIIGTMIAAYGAAGSGTNL